MSAQLPPQQASQVVLTDPEYGPLNYRVVSSSARHPHRNTVSPAGTVISAGTAVVGVVVDINAVTKIILQTTGANASAGLANIASTAHSSADAAIGRVGRKIDFAAVDVIGVAIPEP